MGGGRGLRGSVVVAACAMAMGIAQQAPIFRARTDLVRLDVVVVDADGHAVHGLGKDDFEVIDRGRPQKVAAFDEISHTRAAEPVLPATLKLDVADNSASRSDRLIILVLDDLHFQANTDLVKGMARRVVTDIGPRASLALVTTSGVFGVEPTEDRALLLAELDRFLDKFDPEGRRLAPGARAPAPAPIVNALGARVTVRGPEDPARFFGDMTGFTTVQDVAKKIGVNGRRNAFVWISGGMNGAAPLAKCDAGKGDDRYCGALQGLLEALRKANVAAYSITTSEFKATLLKDVADATGGFVMNATHFDRDLPRLIDDLDHYYLIGFYPDDTSDRKFHPVDVRVKRPGLTVRYRRGYQPGEPAKPKNANPLARMSEGVLPVADLPLRLTATPLPGGGKGSRAVISLEIQADRARLAEADGHLRDVLRYEVWAIDLRKKKPVKSVAREARLDLDPAEAAAAASDPLVYQIHTALALDPGRYQLRASVTSAKAGKGGSVFHETEIPDFTRAPAVGAIVLGYAAGPRVPIVRGGLGVGLLPIAPTLDREFPAAENLRVVCEIVKRSLDSVDVTVDLLRGTGESVKRLVSHRFGRAEVPRVDDTLSLKDLTPGGYRLRVTATEGEAVAQREAGFLVK
jgi:VWFA-related protein